MDRADLPAVAKTTLETLLVLGRVFASRMRCTREGAMPGHYALLAAVAEKSRSLGELAEHMQVSAATMSATVQTLVGRGWVRRQRSDEDRRIVTVSATPAGLEVLKEMRHEAQMLMQELLGSLGPEELARLSAGIEILRRVVEAPSAAAIGAEKPSGAE
ncbi:MAG: MarR family transcriptional regulator [Chloroflexi bacterium]|nr:MarR family transcriptional regulator [Chloroflexota bacterium]